MSNTQMGRESIRLIKHLAENGPRTVTALLAAFPSENRHDLQRRLSNLEQGWWVQKMTGGQGDRAWRVNPNAYTKLPSIGLQVPPPPSAKRGVGRPRDVVTGPAPGVLPARRDNVYEAPVWKGWEAAPTRAGSMDFLSCPSRGAI